MAVVARFLRCRDDDDVEKDGDDDDGEGDVDVGGDPMRSKC